MNVPIAIIHGASGGIGSAIAKKLLPDFDLFLLGRNLQLLQQLRDELQIYRPKANIECYPLDITEMQDYIALANNLKEKKYYVAALVNCIGVVPIGTITEVKEEDWEMTFQVSFMSAVRFIKALAPLMYHKGGSIVLVNGVLALQPDPNLIISSSITGALRNLAKGLSKDLIQYGVRVNSVYPGATKTKLWRLIAEDFGKKLKMGAEQFTANVALSNPMKDLANPDDIANMVHYFCSAEARYINGSTVVIDGGACMVA